MPKLNCRCGNVLDYGRIPSEIDYLFISDVDFDKYQGDINSEELYKEMKNFLKCPRCHRIWMFWNGFNEKPVEYKPVEDE